jgi:hypothetical protein
VAALSARYEADHVIDVLPDFLLLGAKRPGPELSYGEPKTVALVIGTGGQLASQVDLAWGMGDEGASVELTYEYLGRGLIRTRQHSTSCSMESAYRDCEESTHFETFRLGAKGTFEPVTPDGRFCDPGSGEELELATDPDKPLQSSVTYRSKGKPAGLKLHVREAESRLTRLTVVFPKSGAVYALELADDFTRLTSAALDGKGPEQIFSRAACAR